MLQAATSRDRVPMRWLLGQLAVTRATSVFSIYRVFRAQADRTFILPSELPTKELCRLPRKMPPQTYQSSNYVVPGGGIFLGKWRSSFVGSSDGKMNVRSACVLNTRYNVVNGRNELTGGTLKLPQRFLCSVVIPL
jgi:hypothetical protein